MGNNLEWIVSDNVAVTFRYRFDFSLWSAKFLWASDVPIIVNVDGFAVGNYTVQIEITGEVQVIELVGVEVLPEIVDPVALFYTNVSTNYVHDIDPTNDKIKTTSMSISYNNGSLGI